MVAPEDVNRKLIAKRNNERIKLISNALNAIAVAVIGAAVIFPTIASLRFLLTPKAWVLILFAVVLHVAAHATLGLLRSED